MKFLLAVVLLAALAGCNRSDGAATLTSPTSDGTAPAIATALALRGNALLTAIGETTPLTATATMSDGTSRNVTTAAQWVSSDASCIIVSTDGRATAIRFGQSYITATYEGESGSLNLQAAPSGTFVVWGRAWEPGGSGLPGAVVREPSSGISAVAGMDGEFSLGGLTGVRLTIEKAGYERATLEAKPGVFTDAPMQRVIRIAAGGSVEVGLAPHDVSYEPAAGARCYPCRMIRVLASQAGRLRVKASWTEPRARLYFWVAGRIFDATAPAEPLAVLAEVAVDVPGEVLVYVGMKNAADYRAPLTLTTDLVK